MRKKKAQPPKPPKPPREPIENKRQVAKWRRKGHGIWHIIFVVLGFDEEFLMRAPGRLSETFAVAVTRRFLSKFLKVRRSHIIHKESKKEP